MSEGKWPQKILSSYLKETPKQYIEIYYKFYISPELQQIKTFCSRLLYIAIQSISNEPCKDKFLLPFTLKVFFPSSKVKRVY